MYFFSSVDIFLVPSKWFFNSTTQGHEDVKLLATTIATKWNVSIEELSILYDARVGTNSKLFIFILLPIIALGLMIIGYSRYKQYGIHLVHAVHLFTFLLVTFLFLYIIIALVPGNHSGIYILAPIMIILSFYFTHSIKRIFNFEWVRSFFSSLVLVAFVLSASAIFRNMISFFTLKSLEYSFFMEGF